MAETFDLADLDIPEDSEYRRLLEACPDAEPKRFSDGDLLITEGDRSQEIFLVLRGAYVVEQARPCGNDAPGAALATVISSLDRPSVVGEMAYLGDTQRTASVRSSGTTFTLCLKPKHLDVIIEDFPAFTQILCRQFSRRLKEANEIVKKNERERAMNVDQVMKSAGQVVFAKGEPADVLYQIIDGVLVREEDGSQITAQTAPDGFVDPLPFFRGGTYASTVRAKNPAMLVSIAKESKLAIIRNYPQLLLSALQ
ncbi:MAG TPA: cyclic nucleotide-binding domain-containing protein [Candidatus Hydrogenedentes bacterium]|nr:cyclic nucleotide-binding domain-containing protein [Candidatus Hydrogenedentota bacterium]HIJ73594.1 cyclic nucleotide-binding domain-containing protein [Candidatus Hydrogenedentota bacterium]